MQLYLETSAVLTWALGQADGPAIEAILKRARALYSSELTLAECSRALQRMNLTGDLTVRRRLDLCRSQLNHVPILSALLVEVGRAFPVEPVRTLDAVHLVTALHLHSAIPRLAMVSLDNRVRDNSQALGLNVLP